MKDEQATARGEWTSIDRKAIVGTRDCELAFAATMQEDQEKWATLARSPRSSAKGAKG